MDAFILLNDELEVKQYLKCTADINEDLTIVALSPFARYELDKCGIDYNLIEDFYEPEELYRLGLANFRKVETICRIVDPYLKENIMNVQEANLNICHNDFFRLKVLYDSISIKIFQLRKMMAEISPKKIYFFAEKSHNILDGKNFLKNSVNLYSMLLQSLDWNVSTIPLEKTYQETSTDKSKKICLKDDILRHLLGIPFIFELGLTYKKSGASELLKVLKQKLSIKNSPSILIHGGGYNWDHMQKVIRKITGWRIYRTPFPKEFITSENALTKETVRALKENQDLRKCFSLKGIDFSPVFSEILSAQITPMVETEIKLYELLSAFFEEKNVRLVLSSTYGDFSGHIISIIAREMNIPVVLWQHGSYGYFDRPMTFYQDIKDADYLFVFGDGVKEKYRSIGQEHHTKIIPVGSTILERLQKSKKPPRKIQKRKRNAKSVVYVTTNYSQNALYIGGFAPIFSDNKLYETQKYLIDYYGEKNSARFIVKYHQSRDYRDPLFNIYSKEMGFNNIQFEKNEYTFADLVECADAVIIDFPTTTLLQSLITEKPVFVFTGLLNIDDEPLELLKKRAYCFDDIEHLTMNLDNYLEDLPLEQAVDLNNQEFVIRYGIHNSNSEQEAIILLKEIIKNTSHSLP